MRKRLHFILGLAGFMLLLVSIFLALFYQFPFYYSFLIIGWFLFFDYLDYKLNGESIVGFFLNKKNYWVSFLVLSFLAICGILADYVYGRRIASLWIYPHYNNLLNWASLYLIIYLFGALSMYETYKVMRRVFSREFKEKHLYNLHLKKKKYVKFMHLLPYFGLLFLLYPIVNFFFFKNIYANYFYGLSLFGAWFLFDYISFIHNGRVLIHEIIEGRLNVILGILSAAILGIVFHECTNIFVWEWRYQNLPLTNFSIFGVPIVVIGGWVMLVIVCVSCYNMVKSMEKKK